MKVWDPANHEFCLVKADVLLSVNTSPFASGGTRFAYHAEPCDALPLDPCNPLKHGIIAKGSKKQSSKSQEHQLQVDDAVCLQAAKDAVDVFNTLLESKTVALQTPSFVDCHLLCCGGGNNVKYLSIEPFLEGSYTKFNGNEGYVAALPDDAADREAHELAQAFSHWSWVHSGGRELLCDIQGVGARWTDPQVNSVATKYGRKDMGFKGIAAFFGSHRCNESCHTIGINKKWLEA
ncbi:alpha-type protein kinase domain-containing protein [Haematococcus lacustris]|uniref:Alpha-type protein kinase domain-containing protein n=1 Tax=Haematococcus lacustris TaxID=44745 RepID=A0A699ZPS5_HAELA|nr:alpha-type protein kinase domain-containing protein [Haematococcus lacustris]